MLGRPVRDVDLVVETGVSAFARALAEILGARLREHGRFATATITLPDGTRFDLAAPRRESYPHPGSLPVVEPGAAIEEDLARRDFTINAMALQIAPGAHRLVDPNGGARDLALGIIRMLHGSSALDDPTRAFRAVRYANRLGFRLAAATRSAIARAVREKAFDFVSGDRLRRELELVLSETGRGSAARRIHALRLDTAVDPGLLLRRQDAARIGRAEAIARRSGQTVGWLCYLLSWMGEASPARLRRVADRLAIAGRSRAALEAWPETRRAVSAALATRARAEIARRARRLSPEELVAAAATLKPSDRAKLLRSAQQRVSLGIGGKELVSAGIPPGPAIGAALARAREAREDGRIAPWEELEFALRAARGILRGTNG